jgi:hypothetical protein
MTGAVRKHAYQEAYGDAAGYGGAYYGGGGAMQTHDGYKQKAGYGYGGGAMQKQMMYGTTAGGGYNYNGGGAYQYNKAHGSAAKTGFAGGYHSHGAVYESESESESQSESESEESDCEDAAFGHKHGGVHSYETYKREEEHGGGVR